MATTRDTPTEFVFPPDWSEGVRNTVVFVTRVVTSESGFEQRSSLMQDPKYSLEYTRQGRSTVESRFILDVRLQRGRKVLISPWWSDARVIKSVGGPDGLAIDVQLTSDQLKVGSTVYIYNQTTGGEFREVATVIDRRLVTLVPKVGSFIFSVGDWLIPTHICTLEDSSDSIEINRLNDAKERIKLNML